MPDSEYVSAFGFRWDALRQVFEAEFTPEQITVIMGPPPVRVYPACPVPRVKKKPITVYSEFGTCPYCGIVVALKKKGTMTWHLNWSRIRYVKWLYRDSVDIWALWKHAPIQSLRWLWCPGYNNRPKS